MTTQLLAVALRVLRQLMRDRRFLLFSLVIPGLVVGMLWVFFEGLENPFFNIREFIMPEAAFIVHFVAFILCAIALVRERTTQTLERMFANGYRRVTVVSGYILAYSLLGTLQCLVVMGAAQALFRLNYDAIVFLQIYAVTWLLAVISIALGILVSNLARTESHVIPFIPLFILASVFFSGMILPVDRLPDWAAWGRFLTPMYYASEGIQALLGKSGHTLASVAVLPLYGLVTLTLATWTLRERE